MSVWVAVVLTILAAVAFQPLRHRVEALADRWVYGSKINRYQLLTTFGAETAAGSTSTSCPGHSPR